MCRCEVACPRDCEVSEWERWGPCKPINDNCTVGGDQPRPIPRTGNCQKYFIGLYERKHTIKKLMCYYEQAKEREGVASLWHRAAKEWAVPVSQKFSHVRGPAVLCGKRVRGRHANWITTTLNAVKALAQDISTVWRIQK